MHDEKHFNWPGEPPSGSEDDEAQALSNGAEVFRNWLNRSPARRRASFDPSLYTWKGYRQWKEGVSRSWSEKED